MNKIDPAISDLLGQIIAQIHTLPPLIELGNLTDSIRPESWDMPLRDCVRDNLTGFFKLYRDTPHFASVAISAQFNWLLQHIPPLEGCPCLVHGVWKTVQTEVVKILDGVTIETLAANRSN